MRTNAIYRGRIIDRGPQRCMHVIVRARDAADPGILINPRHDIRAYSKEFRWGNNSPGAAQTALAIMADLLHGEENAQGLADTWHDRFTSDVIAQLKMGQDWTMPASQILDWMESVREEIAEAYNRERFELTVAEPFDGLS